ncbi:MAG: NAD(P)H-dependent glycerol-3-phosphate dehydrogenase [Actinobacteria bacterium]|nr:NAD(P)H-dependent glycerol-3-phosphate dehydrogenase [Actinomycetota bacterium]
MRPVHVAVLGGGSWGTTVASLAAANASAMLWARDEATVAEVNERHRNSRYLPDLDLHPDLRATTSIEEAVYDADVIVMGVPSQSVRATLVTIAPLIRHWVPIVSLTKGLEQGTRLRMTEVIEQELAGHPAGVLAGPNLAREVVAGFAAAAVIAMPDAHVATSLQKVFTSRRFRVYTNPDVTGCELGGALKNVVAIAAGMAEGLGVGDNTKAMVLTRGLAEITRLGVAMGGDPRTFPGLTGLGDLMATCSSPLSRNRTVGVELAKGRSIDEITAGMRMVAEGVKTSRVVVELAREYGVEAPIADEVDEVVNGGRAPLQAYAGLGRIAPTSEWDGTA